MKTDRSITEIYSLYGIFKLMLCYIRTRLFFPRVRLIRFPIEIRGKRYIDFGRQLTTGVGCRIEAYPFYKKSVIIKFGDNIEINDYVHIAGIESIEIGDNVLIASKVFISDIQHGSYSGVNRHDHPDSVPKDRPLTSAPVVIKENVWISENVAILKGVTVGKGCIIGANSVVTKNIPDYSIAVGIPAKVIKTFNEKSGEWEVIK